MVTTEVENVEKVLTKTVGSSGQVSVGKDLAGTRVQVVVSVLDEEE
jgi:putative transposon-encoded protein